MLRSASLTVAQQQGVEREMRNQDQKEMKQHGLRGEAVSARVELRQELVNVVPVGIATIPAWIQTTR